MTDEKELCPNPNCRTELMNAPGIGLYCPNMNCGVVDNIDNYDNSKSESESESKTIALLKLNFNDTYVSQKEVHELAKQKGWWDNERSDFTLLALITSEVGEAIEEVREGNLQLTVDEYGKPEGLPSELADIVIRIMDMCEARGYALQEIIRIKHEYNKTRSHKHGGKLE